MAGHQPDATATRDFRRTITTDDVTQEFGTIVQNGFATFERLQYEYTPAGALDAELSLDSPANYPKFDVDIDWHNLYNDPLLAQKALDKMMTVSATGAGGPFSPGFPYEPSHGASAEQLLHKSLDESATKPESDCSPCFSNTHYVSHLPQTQDTSVQESNSACWENAVDPVDLLAYDVEDLANLFGIFDTSGGREVDNFLPASFELPDETSGLDFLQDLQLIGREVRPAMSPELLPRSTDDRAIQGSRTREAARDGSPSASSVALSGSSEPHSLNENLAVLTNPRRLFRGYQGGATHRQPDRARIQRKNRYIENSAYTPLKKAPDKWDIFEYTEDGELDPLRLFSAEEIDRFLFTHPLNRVHRDLKESPLRIRVHKTPASSAKRFPNKLR